MIFFFVAERIWQLFQALDQGSGISGALGYEVLREREEAAVVCEHRAGSGTVSNVCSEEAAA